MLLLCTDLHLDDNPANEYRWRVFDELASVCDARPVSCVHCLGDMTDRRDRFPANLVNRLVRSWADLPVPKVILDGNHTRLLDDSLRAFWAFLSYVPDLEYVTRPTARGDLILLPFSANPRAEWRDLRIGDYRAAFLHATRSGAIAENGHVLPGQDLPPIPRSVKVYSGDIHTQQTIDNWTYVGASHPVKYGDDYPCRFLLLDEDSYDVVEEIGIATMRKRVVEMASLDDLTRAEVSRGDQVQVRVSIAPGALDWGAFEAGVDRWARERGVEVTFSGGYEVQAQTGEPGVELDPGELLAAFAAEEGVEGDLLDAGQVLLREVRG
jgi:hypothetical protein